MKCGLIVEMHFRDCACGGTGWTGPPGVERPVRCKRVVCMAGTLDLPIIVGDKVIGSTGQSFSWTADSAPIGGH